MEVHLCKFLYTIATIANSHASKIGNMRDVPSQAPSPFNVRKILNTINNLVRVLELVLTLSALQPPITPPAIVVLPKVTTLRSGLN